MAILFYILSATSALLAVILWSMARKDPGIDSQAVRDFFQVAALFAIAGGVA